MTSYYKNKEKRLEIFFQNILNQTNQKESQIIDII